VLTRTNRRIARAAAIGALGAAVALGSTACSAGKISQTNNQAPAINAAGADIFLGDPTDDPEMLAGNSIAVRNVQIMFPAERADTVFGDGGPFKLNFTIANDSPLYQVKLTGITAETGKVEFINGSARSATPGEAGTIAPSSALTAGLPSLVPADEAKKDGIERIDVELSGTGDTVAPGLTTPLTFTFQVLTLEEAQRAAKGEQVAGVTKSVTVNTPVDATALDDRVDVVRDVQADDGHH